VGGREFDDMEERKKKKKEQEPERGELFQSF
jgi:hypothetical protein